jgi:transposase-like protein
MELPRANVFLARMRTNDYQQRRASWNVADARDRRATAGARGPGTPGGPNPASPREPALAAVVRIAQQARKAHGGGCPRCGSRRVVGWGGFSGRCRYRCHGCGRTFSDFTGTPIAYSKRAESWLVFTDCVLDSLTIRRSAARLNVRVPTAFRWRHALLSALRQAAAPVLAGRVELADARYRYSEKGARTPGPRAGERRTPTYAPDQRAVLVLFGCDATHATLAEVVGEHLLSAALLQQALVASVARGSSIVAAAGRFSPYAVACKRAGMQFRPTPRRWTAPGDARRACHAAHRLRTRFEAWVERFYGVATRYLPNYLRWSLYLGAGGEPHEGDTGARLLAACCVTAAAGEVAGGEGAMRQPAASRPVRGSRYQQFP